MATVDLRSNSIGVNRFELGMYEQIMKWNLEEAGSPL